MKRDCGEGDLIPYKWEVVSCIGKSDVEYVQDFFNKDIALVAYAREVALADSTPCSNIRFYVKDKKGYCNCLMSYFHQTDGKKMVTDRMTELDK